MWLRINLAVAVIAFTLLGSCASNAINYPSLSSDPEERLMSVWPQVKRELFHGAELPPSVGDSERQQIIAVISQLDTLVSQKEYGAMAKLWDEEDCAIDAFMGINWAYSRGSNAAKYLEWARWHVRKLEKSLAVLARDKDFKRRKKWLYDGTLKQAPKPPHPFLD